MPQRGHAGQVFRRQPPRGHGWRPMPESLGTDVAGPCHPLTDRALADPQSHGNLALRPVLLLEVPGLEPSASFQVCGVGFMHGSLPQDRLHFSCQCPGQ
jgi:hypothetical protein